jgi:hypothetical protein
MRLLIRRNGTTREKLILQIVDEVKQAGVTADELMKTKKNVARASSRRAHHDARAGVRCWIELVSDTQSEFQVAIISRQCRR